MEKIGVLYGENDMKRIADNILVVLTLMIAESYTEEWIEAFDGKVKKLVLLGQTREKIAEAARKVGFEDIILVDTLEEAVQVCAENANEGEAVIERFAYERKVSFDQYWYLGFGYTKVV